MSITRRQITASLGAIAGGVCLAGPLSAQAPVTLEFATAGPGSAFLPYGEAVAKLVNMTGGLRLNVVQTKGSIENLGYVQGSANRIATAFIGSAFEALNGLGPFAGRQMPAIRAIAPMYETSFQLVAKISSGLTKVADLAGKQVGVGPAGGPAEAFFKGLVETAGLQVSLRNGTTAELEAQYLAGSIDALWQGASVPIPALVRLATAVPSTVFGLSAGEVEAMLRRFPYLAPGEVPASSYPGQPNPIRSVAAWNVIVAHADLADDTAYQLARAILTAEGLAAATNGAGAGTRAENAVKNRAVPWHPGAARYLREKGIAI